MDKITKIHAREILDSRGSFTLEVEVVTESGACGIASVPSGASKGIYEATELRDTSPIHGVSQAVNHVNKDIASIILGMDVFNQKEIDEKMIQYDGTKDKHRLGANAILGVSLAVCKCAAQSCHLPLYHYIGGLYGNTLPTPMMNILNGGAHSNNNLDFQEFLIIPNQNIPFQKALKMGVLVFRELKNSLKENGLSIAVGDEGGFAPNLKNHDEAFKLIINAIKQAGFEPGKDIYLGIDAASSELYKDGMYDLKSEHHLFSTNELIDYYQKLCDTYPIISIEDGLDQDDLEGWEKLTRKLGHKIQLVGDDLFVTNIKRLSLGINQGLGNAILIKPNQIGTLTETFNTIQMAKSANYNVIISHRSGDTEETFIADLAVATNAGQIKTGSLSRQERTAKYNRLLKIENELYNNTNKASILS